MQFADLDTAALPSGGAVAFTFYWKSADRWEEKDFLAAVE